MTSSLCSFTAYEEQQCPHGVDRLLPPFTLRNFAEAKRVCTSLGKIVATASDDLHSRCMHIARGADFIPYWAGIRTTDGGKNFFLDYNNRPIVYTNWSAGQPHTFDGTEGCVEMLDVGGQNGWGVAPCFSPRKFFCERPIGKFGFQLHRH